MFWTGFLSIIEESNMVYTAIGICRTGYADCLLAENLSDTCRVLFQK